jgi:hypothetical protein
MSAKQRNSGRLAKPGERMKRSSGKEVRYLNVLHDNCYLNTESLIEQGRACAMYGAIDFDSTVWLAAEATDQRAHKQRDLNLIFTAHKTEADIGQKVGSPFRNESGFADTVKAIIRLRAQVGGQTPNNQSEVIIAFRYLHDQLSNDNFDLRLLSREHLDAAALEVEKREVPISRYKRIQKLEEIADVMDSNRLTLSKLDWRCSWNTKPDGDRAGHEETANTSLSLEPGDTPTPHPKMPKDGVIEAVAHLYKVIPDGEWADRVRICFVSLLVLTGFRIGELLTLPALRVQTEEDTGRQYLIFYPEKGAPPQKKWLMTAGGKLAGEIVDEILRLTAQAREVATWLHDHPGAVDLKFPNDEGETLKLADINEVLKISSYSGLRQFITTREVPIDNGRVSKSELTAALRADSYSAPVSIVSGTGEQLFLKDALACAFGNAFHSSKKTLTYAVVPIAEQQISDFICGRASMPAVFERYGVVGPDGSTLTVASHAFRHWLNDCFDRGGLSDLEQAVYFGRLNPKDNRAYQHMSQQDRVRAAREALKRGDMKGPVADKIRNLPIKRQDAILAARVQAVHIIPGGACFHQFSQSACPNQTACKNGCGDFHWQTDDQAQTKELQFEKEFLEVAVETAKREVAEESYGADVWLQHNLQKLAQVDRCLADSIAVER